MANQQFKIFKFELQKSKFDFDDAMDELEQIFIESNNDSDKFKIKLNASKYDWDWHRSTSVLERAFNVAIQVSESDKT